MTKTKQHPETGEALYLTEVPMEDLMDPGWRWQNRSGSVSLMPDDSEDLPLPSYLEEGPTLMG